MRMIRENIFKLIQILFNFFNNVYYKYINISLGIINYKNIDLE